jgi:phosphoglycolate phosphatase
VTIRLVVFDLDGTLVDSLRDLADSANALLVECGAQPLDEAAVGGMVGDGAATLVARAFSAARIDQPADALERFLAIYETRLLDHTRAYLGIPETLNALSTRAALAVLTNKPRDATDRILAGLHLAEFFPNDAVIGGDGPFPRKPDPAGLAHLCAHAGVSPGETALVGDSAVDWRTARSAGTHIFLASYGFGFRQFPRAELRGDEQIIKEPADLIARLDPP